MTVGRKLQLMVLRALAIGMPNVPADFFDEYHSEADNQLRLLHCELSFARAPACNLDGC